MAPTSAASVAAVSDQNVSRKAAATPAGSAPVRITTNTAPPIAPPTRDRMVICEVASGSCRALTVAKAAETAGMPESARPMPRATMSSSTVTRSTSAGDSASATVLSVVTTRPASVTIPPPWRSVSRPATGKVAAAPRLNAVSSSPVSTMPARRWSWSYSGMTISPPNRAAPLNSTSNDAAA